MAHKTPTHSFTSLLDFQTLFLMFGEKVYPYRITAQSDHIPHLSLHIPLNSIAFTYPNQEMAEQSREKLKKKIIQINQMNQDQYLIIPVSGNDVV